MITRTALLLFLVLACIPAVGTIAQQPGTGSGNMPPRSSHAEPTDSIIILLPTLEGEQKLQAYEDLCQLIKFASPQEMLPYVHDFRKEAHRQGNLEKEGWARFLEIEVYYNNKMYDEMTEALPAHLEFMYDNEQWYNYFSTYNLKVSSIIFSQDSNMGIDEAQKMYDIATRVKYDQGIAAALLNLGKGYTIIRRDSEATKVFEEAMQLLDKHPRSTFRYSGYWHLTRQYADENALDKLLALLKQWEAEINQRIAEGDSPDSFDMEYNEIYMGYGKVYGRNDELEKALEYVELARPYTERLGRGTVRRQLWNLEVNIFYMQERYDELLPLLDKIYQSAIEDGEGYTAMQMLRKKARVYAVLGDADKTETYYEYFIEKRDSVNGLNLESRISEMQTRYEVDRHIAEKAAQKNYLLLSAAIIALLLLAMAGAVYHNRRLHRRNLIIVQQLRERDKLAEALRPLPVDQPQATPDIPDAPASEQTNIKARILADLNRLMDEQQYYLKTDITRESLAEKLMTNETYLREVITEQFGYTFTDYIVRLRLNHARMMLIDGASAGYTIEGIAMDSGFNSRATFYRQFKKKYGMSPEEYRKLAVE